MKRLLLAVLVLGSLALTGCAIVPAGPYYYGGGPGVVLVAPAVSVPPPIFVSPYRRYDRGWGGGGWRRGR